jgi:hypothetical protein
MAPPEYRKIFFVERSLRDGRDESCSNTSAAPRPT